MTDEEKKELNKVLTPEFLRQFKNVLSLISYSKLDTMEVYWLVEFMCEVKGIEYTTIEDFIENY